MIYLSGAIRDELAGVPDMGFMYTPNMGNRHRPGVTWAADNGCFTQGDRFDVDRYLAWLLARRAEARRCLFATAPDVLADPVATWRRSAPVLPRLRALGYPAALVAQDGMERTRIDWRAFDVLFIGGTAWKLGAACAGIVAEAKRRGKWVHMGRVNSYRRISYAAAIGCDSCDGTYVAFGPDRNAPRVRRWLAAVNGQTALELVA